MFEKGGKPCVAIAVKLSGAPNVERNFYTACEELKITKRLLVTTVEEPFVSKHQVPAMLLLQAIQKISK